MLKIRNNSIDLILKKPEMYLGNNQPNADYLQSILADDANILGCKNLESLTKEGWNILTAEANWLEGTIKIHSYPELFTKLLPFPEGGVNSVRSEAIVYAFTKKIFIWDKDGVHLIKGESPSKDVLDVLKSNPNISFAVGFSVD